MVQSKSENLYLQAKVEEDDSRVDMAKDCDLQGSGFISLSKVLYFLGDTDVSCSISILTTVTYQGNTPMVSLTQSMKDALPHFKML